MSMFNGAKISEWVLIFLCSKFIWEMFYPFHLHSTRIPYVNLVVSNRDPTESEQQQPHSYEKQAFIFNCSAAHIFAVAVFSFLRISLPSILKAIRFSVYSQLLNRKWMINCALSHTYTIYVYYYISENCEEMFRLCETVTHAIWVTIRTLWHEKWCTGTEAFILRRRSNQIRC